MKWVGGVMAGKKSFTNINTTNEEITMKSDTEKSGNK